MTLESNRQRPVDGVMTGSDSAGGQGALGGRVDRATGPDAIRTGRARRPLHCVGLGRVHLSVPQDRAGADLRHALPERRGQDDELDACIAKCVPAELSACDLVRSAENQLGTHDDAQQGSRIVERTSPEVDA